MDRRGPERWRNRATYYSLALRSDPLYSLRMDNKQLSVEDVAQRLSVQPSTVRAYLARQQMPEPDGRIGSTPWWWAKTIEQWRG